MAEPRRFLNDKVALYPGDCMAILPTLAKNSVDAVVTDPPYHLTSIVKRFGAEGAAEAKSGKSGVYKRSSAGFMGKQWDGGDIAFRPETWAEVLRVMKPGAHLVAFGAPKNMHRMISAIEDAGFEIRDCLQWLFGSGFPKGHSASVGIARQQNPDWESGDPLPPEAEPWVGFGSALKPAYEPICLARKRLSESSIAANVLRWGTGALNIDGCRVGVDGEALVRPSIVRRDNEVLGKGLGVGTQVEPSGRWPANIITDGSEEVVGAFPETESGGGARNAPKAAGIYGSYSGEEAERTFDANSGSAARFFYRVEKGALCDLCCLPLPREHDKNMLCDANNAELSSQTESTRNAASALTDAAASQPHDGEAKSPALNGRATTAESHSDQCRLQTQGSALSGAPTPELSKIVQNVRSAADLCGSCATAIAQNLVAMRQGRDPGSLPFPVSISERSAQILRQSLALYAAKREGTDTILTTASLSQWFGSVFHAIEKNTLTSAAEPSGSRPRSSRIWYSSKADSLDRAGSRHPTVKPLDLIQYLCHLICPPNGTILDPFAGTGTTGEAAWREGFRAVLIEREAEYVADIARRMEWALLGPESRARAQVKLDTERGKVKAEPMPLFGGGTA